MEKVKLTREQAEELELQKRELDTSDIVIRRIISRRNNKTFKSIGIDDLIKALYIGYEVEETFNVRDYVTRIDNGQVIKVMGVNRSSKYVYENSSNIHYFKDIRHSTPEEVTREEQRRWWVKKGRKVREFKSNDVVSYNDKVWGGIYIVFSDEYGSDAYGNKLVGVFNERMNDGRILSFKADELRIICFAEDRKDIKEENK